ncbi:cytidylyltransferase domain-containing protein [Lysobacter korlensis]|uniref:N-acylneuraminate cytidylyltransferase n=1 Tax=Lysobacter korlensis TaxID=553636 RepID=A0ABV6RYJ1_9GAMM
MRTWSSPQAELLPEGTVVAIIPARGGSKGVPGKNVARVGGVPLVARAVAAALDAGIRQVVVSTDDDSITAAAEEAGARVVMRPAELAGDTASSESALLHVLDQLEAEDGSPRVVAFLQATSPFIEAASLRSAVDRVLSGDEDVVFSAFQTYAFLWRETGAGAEGVNHDAGHRPRRQDREPHFQETGAFYVMRADGFRSAQHRFFGRVGIEQVPEALAIEIDDPVELERARALALADGARPAVGAVDADALVMDFDGVHTDDLVFVSTDGDEAVRVSRSDGLGLGMLREAGLPMLILSKERNPVVSARGRKLRIEVRQGVDDKLPALEKWAAEHGIPLSRVVFIGNDINDLACLGAVGWPIVVPEAPQGVRASARIVLTQRGGHGALRELADLILAARRELP